MAGTAGQLEGRFVDRGPRWVGCSGCSLRAISERPLPPIRAIVGFIELPFGDSPHQSMLPTGWPMCLAVMDETGDTGLHVGSGSSPSFTLGIVVFQQIAHADNCRNRIERLRQYLGMKLSGKESEFHYTKCSPARRAAFLSAVDPVPFTFCTTSIDKSKLTGRQWQKREFMYQRAGAMTIDQVTSNILEATLIFDATSSPNFDRQFLRFVAKHAGFYEGLRNIKETKRAASHKEDLVQLADMICGAVVADNPKCYRIIQGHETGRVVFP